MISNPFTSANRSGMFGEQSTGIMRFKRSYGFGTGTSVTVGLGNSCGFVLWCPVGNGPSYNASNSTVIDQPLGVVLYKSDNTSDGWANTNSLKFGANEYASWSLVRGTASTGTTSIATPDDTFLGSIANKSRLVSAGMVLRCIASPLLLTGEYVKLENINMDLLLEDRSAAPRPLNVDALFDMTSHTPQPFCAGKTVRHVYINDRHNAGLEADCGDEKTDPSAASAIGTGDSRQTLAYIPKGTSQPTLVTPYGEAHQPKCFGFAFRGVDPNMLSKLFVDCYVSKEFSISAYQGIPQIPVGRTGPDLSEPAHLLATATKSAMDAVDNGVSALSAGLVSKGVSYLGTDVLGLAGFV